MVHSAITQNYMNGDDILEVLNKPDLLLVLDRTYYLKHPGSFLIH
ncbi:hypothetical protein SAMN05421755_100371 [Nitrosomonas sp. Nm33]|nr:hypothetical protein SAMN05421755_100371 [Nitrosomonas sp. Nm33]